MSGGEAVMAHWAILMLVSSVLGKVEGTLYSF